MGEKTLEVCPYDSDAYFTFNDVEGAPVEILRFTADGKIFHMGREIEGDEELVEGLKQWFASNKRCMITITRKEYEELREKAGEYERLRARFEE